MNKVKIEKLEFGKGVEYGNLTEKLLHEFDK